MKTYPIRTDGAGVLFAFEVDSVYLGLESMTRILSSIDGVMSVQRRRLFQGTSDTHIEFSYMGCAHMVWEPFGDSSRYWIGPRDPDKCSVDIGRIEEHFRHYQPPLVRRLVGDILSLQFLKGLFGNSKQE